MGGGYCTLVEDWMSIVCTAVPVGVLSFFLYGSRELDVDVAFLIQSKSRLYDSNGTENL